MIETIYPDDTPDDLSDNPRSKSEYNNAGQRVKEIDAQGHATRFVYDNLGRLVATHFADGTKAETIYDALGRRVAAIDQAGTRTEYEYDALGRLTDVVQFLNGEEIRTEYGYDELGRLIWQEDANNHRTNYEYDNLGRRIAVELPEGQRSTTTYDAVGNVFSATDFNGETTNYQYDERNQLVFIDLPDDPDITFTYTPTGQRSTVTDGRGTTSYEYNVRGQLISRTDPTGPYLDSGATIEYEYDAAGNRTLLRTPGGFTSYEFDKRNRLETVTDSSDGVTTYQYDAVNNLIETVLPNGVVETREYDDLNRLEYLENKRGDQVISSYDYELDEVGNRLSVTEQDGRKVEYEYDSLYRLVSEEISEPSNPERVITYSYDNVSNRLSRNDSVEGIVSYTYDDSDRLLESTINGIVTSYDYDRNGNLISQTVDGKTTNYVWDDRNRLIEAQTADGDIIGYEYNDENIRVSSTINGVKTTYLVDSNRPYAQVLEEYEDENFKARYLHGLDLISVEQDGEISIYLIDGLGSTRVLTNVNGEVVASYTYEAFGNLVNSTGVVDNNYLFAGEQFDWELGQYYLRDRYYDAGFGRFTRRDIYEGDISEPLSLHKYAYTHADPVNYVDPSGRARIHDVLVALVLSDILMRSVGEFFNPLAVDPFSVNIPTPAPLSGATSREVLLRPSSDIVDSFTDLNMHRFDDAVVPAHIWPTRTGMRKLDGVITRLDTGGQTFYGHNSRLFSDNLARQEFIDLGFLNPSGKPPTGAFAHHAEGHAFVQAYQANALHGRGKLFVDSTMCRFCGQSGGVKNAFMSSGLDSLEVYELDNSGLVIKTLFEK